MQATFSIDDAEEAFKRDLKKTFERSYSALASEPPDEGFRVVAREGHMLKGLTAMVQADALSKWGDFLERVAGWAGSQDSARQHSLQQLMREVQVCWQALIDLTLARQFEQADDFFPKVQEWFFARCPAAREVYVEPTSEKEMPYIQLDVTKLKRAAPAAKLSSMPGLKKGGVPVESEPLENVESVTNGHQLGPIPTPREFKRMPGLKMPGLKKTDEEDPILKVDEDDEEFIPEVTTTTAQPETAPPAFVDWFVIDAEEILQNVEQASLAWERGTDPDKATQSILRGLHTLKGSANSVDLMALGSDIHKLEDWLEENLDRKSKKVLGGFFLEVVDDLKAYLGCLKKGQLQWDCPWDVNSLDGSTDIIVTGAQEVEAPTQEAAPEETVLRVSADSLRGLSTEVGELLINRNRLEARFAELASLQEQFALGQQRLQAIIASFQDEFEFTLRKEGNKGESEFSELEFDRYDQFNLVTRRIVEAVADDRERLNQMQERFRVLDTDLRTFSDEARKVQGHLVDLSVVSFQTIVPRLERAFRDALKAYPEKEAQLVVIGENVPIDKDLADRLFNPMLHLVRNAVGHGVEDKETRVQKGKDPVGKVTINVQQLGAEISIYVEDDGSGLNLEKIRNRAVEKGLMAPTVESIDQDMAINLICLPRFSTADTVTSVSGRGIGMDVVKTEVKACNGTVTFQKVDGGTRWVMKLPARMNLGEAVFLRIGSQTLAIPLAYFKRGVLFEKEKVDSDQRGEIYYLENESIPLINLHKVIGTEEELLRGVLIEVENKTAMITCNQILNNYEVVIKELPPLLKSHPFISATTLDPHGAVIPILDPLNLVSLGDRLNRSTQYAELDLSVGKDKTQKKHVLIVDDSLSVRKAQERIIQEIGTFTVDTAVHGVNGLEMMRNRRPDVVFTDLEMPIMDGYELISEIRASQAWRDIPIIVISSRSAEKYINKAMDLQANTFISKPFTKEQILDILAVHLH